jgi:hypothetical protein
LPPRESRGAFTQQALVPKLVAAEEIRVTRGDLRPREVLALGLSIAEYLLPGTHSR